MTDDDNTREERLRQASRKRRREQKEETRQTILDTAGALFLERGATGFSLREVAERCGYSPGTIYLYFENRDAILFTLADEGFARFIDALNETYASTDDVVRRLRLMGETYVRFALHNPANYRLMFVERTDFFERSAEVGGNWMESFQIWNRAVTEAMESLGYPHDEAVAVSDALWGMMHGIVLLAMDMPPVDERRMQDALAFAFRMVNAGLRGLASGG